MANLNKTPLQIKFKQGVAADINTTVTKNLATEGEPHWTTDTDRLYIFDGTQNLGLPMLDTSDQLILNYTAADGINLIVKGAAAQTANLTEWQNSSGTVLSGVDSQGRLFSYGGTGINTNLFFGASGNATLTGTYNVAFGDGAMSSLTTGTYNLAVGGNALQDLTEANLNVAIGYGAGNNITTGTGNMAIGSSTMNGITTGGTNVAIGASAMQTCGNVSQCVAIGQSAFKNIGASGGSNGSVGIGLNVGIFSKSGGQNVFIGTSAGAGTADYTNSDHNTFIGHQAGQGISSGCDYNVCIGSEAGNAITTGDRNIYIGGQSGSRQTTNSNLLIIDNQQRADVATELSHAIIYGVMGANPEDQSLRFNADTFSFGTDADSDVVVNFLANSNSGVLTWMEDEDYFLFGDNVVFPVYERHIQIPAFLSGTPANQPTAITVGTASGLQFPSNANKTVGIQWEIPDDWDGTDAYIEVDWFPDSGAIDYSGSSEVIKWDISYRSIVEGETITNGTAVDLTATTAEDFAQYQTEHTRMTLDFDNGDQPMTAQDHMYFTITRDTAVGGDFPGTVVVTAFEIIYNSKKLPTSN